MYPQTGADRPVQMMSSMLADTFMADLKTWLESAPEQLPSNRAYNNAYGSPEWFQLMYHHSILLLHRRRLVSPGESLGADQTPASVYIDCATSAQAICQLYRQLYISQRLNDTWGSLHVLFLGGVTFLHCLWARAETRAVFRLDKVASTCTSCMIVLAVMSERWTAVEPYRDAFDMLATATQAMMAETPMTLVTPVMPVLSSSGNEQLTDYLSSMAEIGMCSSVEALLTNMIGQ